MGLDRLFALFASVTFVCWAACILPTPLPLAARAVIAAVGVLAFSAALLGQKVRD